MSIKSFLNYLPVIFVNGILFWCYYTYIVQFCVDIIDDKLRKIIYIIIFNLGFIMMLWSFLWTIFQTNDLVPIIYRLSITDHAKLLSFNEDQRNEILKDIINKRDLEVYTRTQNGYIRYCKICRLIKPDRAHHCTTCEICVLKMDHHCPWVNNCVGYANYKGFMLLLFYGSFCCIFYMATTLEYLIIFYTSIGHDYPRTNICFCFAIAFVLSVMLLGLFLYHMRMIFRNETTLETIQDLYFISEFITFDMGKAENFFEVFGNNCLLWLLPFETSTGNGYTFLIRNDLIN